ncbi:MAG: zonular occludens toxin domain-containing protein [Methylococcus sp.]|nr:zonular occludens toxin domain-containing protein [Methylococcus sp.]
MSILAYVGLPGAGKSYGVIENVILPSVKRLRPIWTNIPLVMQEWEIVWPDVEIRVFDNAEAQAPGFWSALPGGAVVVIDEAWRFWPAGIKSVDLTEEHKSFFAEHRHKVGANRYSQEIVLIVQDLTNLCSYVRNLVDKTFVATKLDTLGADKRYRVDIYGGPQRGPRYPVKSAIRQLFGSYKPEIYRLYQSHTKALDDMVGIEAKPDGRATIWGNGLLKFGMPAALLFGVVAIRGVWGFFHPEAPAKPSPAPVVASSAVLAPYDGSQVAVLTTPLPVPAPTPEPVAALPSPSPTPEPKVSEDWRLVGMSGEGAQRRVYLQGKRKKFRVIRPSRCIDLDFEPQCLVDGETVSRWSGPAAVQTPFHIAENLAQTPSFSPSH